MLNKTSIYIYIYIYIYIIHKKTLINDIYYNSNQNLNQNSFDFDFNLKVLKLKILKYLNLSLNIYFNFMFYHYKTILFKPIYLAYLIMFSKSHSSHDKYQYQLLKFILNNK